MWSDILEVDKYIVSERHTKLSSGFIIEGRAILRQVKSISRGRLWHGPQRVTTVQHWSRRLSWFPPAPAPPGHSGGEISQRAWKETQIQEDSV